MGLLGPVPISLTLRKERRHEMGGLGALFVIGLYIFIAYKVVKWARPTWLKALALMVALLIPTADAIYGRIKLKQMCAVEAGLKINRVAEHVEGFMASTADELWLKQYRYQYSEGHRSPQKYYRIARQDGQIVVEENVIPKSRYRLTDKYLGEKKAYSHYQYLIEDMATGEVLATDTQLTYNGGWAERLIAMFSDAGGGNVAGCSNSPYPEIRIQNLVKSSLKP